MITKVYFGELTDARKKNWHYSDGNPFSVLKENHEVNIRLEIIDYAKKYFHEEIQIDWGSFAWKCSLKEFTDCLKAYKLKFPLSLDENGLDEKGEYGVVFIEAD